MKEELSIGDAIVDHSTFFRSKHGRHVEFETFWKTTATRTPKFDAAWKKVVAALQAVQS